MNAVQYKEVFDLYYEELYSYSCSILLSEIYVEDILQNTFIKLWQKSKDVKIETVKAYLYTAVRNECLNHIKHKGVHANYFKHTVALNNSSEEHNHSEAKELGDKIRSLLCELPEKCATVFYMSRQLGLSNKEVAANLGISIKTVENQMTKALRFLRNGLAEYLISLLLLFITQLISL
ncbi:MAG TPA: RNA polymerase sigma-70 factor [Defluviitaleaceae bacterium]|nr:RNA polymerase sigma-70 factor [Defluviitaleaceae bacterium]